MLACSSPRDGGSTESRCLEKLLHHLNGQALIIRFVLSEFSRLGTSANSEQKQLDFLRSQECFLQLQGTRVFGHIDAMYHKFDKGTMSQAKFLDELIAINKSPKPFLYAERSLRDILLPSGVFFQDDENVNLVYLLCPAAFDILLSFHKTGEFVPQPSRASFEEFLVTVIQRMDRRRLIAATSKVTNVPDDILRREFYRSFSGNLL